MNNICPNCEQEVNSSFSRLIVDTCGHKKCRICLLQEGDGCKTCIRIESIGSSEKLWEKNQPQEPRNLLESEKNEELEKVNNQSDFFQEKNSEILSDTISRISKKLPSKGRRKKSADRTHIVIIPGDPERYKCTICDKIFQNKKGKCYHDVCKTGIRPYRCEICNRTFVKKSHYEYHERVHSGFKPFQCVLCTKAFPQKNKLNRHMLCHNSEKKFACLKCEKKYSKKEDLKAHVSTHSGLTPHACEICGKSFRMSANLKRHIQIHSNDRPHVCNHCGKGFKDKSLLARHKRTHGKERPYCCDHCSRVFLAKSELLRHIAIHSDLKPFSCEICQTDFRRRDNLNRHIRHHHSEESETHRRNEAESKKIREEKKKETAKLKKISKEKKMNSREKSKYIVIQNSTESMKNVRMIVKTPEKIIEDYQRNNLIINFTPVIRAPGELSNAVPVINGPMSMKRSEEGIEPKKQILTYTQPIPCAAAVVINQRIEEKLDLQDLSTKNSLFFRENSNTIESNLPSSILQSLRHHPPIREVPVAEGRVHESNISPPKSSTFIELKAPIMREIDADEESKLKKCLIVKDKKMNVTIEQSEGTNCVSTIIRNTMSEIDKKEQVNEKRNQQIHWRRRTAEILKPHLN